MSTELVSLTSPPRWYGTYAYHVTCTDNPYPTGMGHALGASGYQALEELVTLLPTHSPIIYLKLSVALSFEVQLYEGCRPIRHSLRIGEDVKFWVDVADTDRFSIGFIEQLSRPRSWRDRHKAEPYRQAVEASRKAGLRHVLRCNDGFFEPYDPHRDHCINTANGIFDEEALRHMWQLTPMGTPETPLMTLLTKTT